MKKRICGIYSFGGISIDEEEEEAAHDETKQQVYVHMMSEEDIPEDIRVIQNEGAFSRCTGEEVSRRCGARPGKAGQESEDLLHKRYLVWADVNEFVLGLLSPI